MSRLLLTALLCAAMLPVYAAKPKSDQDKTLYALGLVIAQNLERYGFNEKELKMLKEGLTDGALGRDPAVDLQEFGPKIQELAQARGQISLDKEKAAAEKFVAEMAGREGARRTDSGMVIIPMNTGDGASPAATDRVRVHYHGTMRDGSVFDSSVERGSPATFGLNQVIPCWTEGLQLMKVGAKATLVCPSAIAYGDAGRPPQIPPGAALAFEVELLAIEAPAK